VALIFDITTSLAITAASRDGFWDTGHVSRSSKLPKTSAIANNMQQTLAQNYTNLITSLKSTVPTFDLRRWAPRCLSRAPWCIWASVWDRPWE
jgi:hypothetical protein